MNIISLQISGRAKQLLIQIQHKKRAVLNDLAYLLWVELLLEHYCSELANQLVYEGLSSLRDTEMVPDGLVSELLCQDGDDSVKDCGGLQESADLLLVLYGLPGDALG